jgi:hypothetical protein
MTNWLIILAGILAGVTAFIHTFIGEKDVARPLLASPIGETIRLTLYACWHLVSAALLLSSLALLLSGAGVYMSSELIAFISIMWILFGIVFLVVTLGIAKPRGILRFPQWTLLILVGLLGLWGIT